LSLIRQRPRLRSSIACWISTRNLHGPRPRSADRLIEAVRRQDLEVEWVLETHVHADHLSAAPYRARLRTGVDRQYIREKIPIEPCRKRAGQIALSRNLEP
jgi:glyoxylase-like metal-dependent hydrolase (beta-lactamase superfamily II)